MLRRVRHTRLGIRDRELDRVRVHLGGSDDLSRVRVPRVGLRALHGRTQLSVKVLHCIFDTAVSNPLDSSSH